VGRARNAHADEAGTSLAASNRNRNQVEAEVPRRHVKSGVPERRITSSEGRSIPSQGGQSPRISRSQTHDLEMKWSEPATEEL
jgi:hypothetical protein